MRILKAVHYSSACYCLLLSMLLSSVGSMCSISADLSLAPLCEASTVVQETLLDIVASTMS